MAGSNLGGISGGKKGEPWPGGYIRRGKRGPTYVIERWVDGVRFHVSTRAHNITSAMKHYERFQSDPDNYRPADGKVGLTLTAELILEYSKHQISKELSRGWIGNVARSLASWAEDLGGRDLRKLRLHEDIKPALARRKTDKAGRISALKGFFKWLRREKGLLTHASDVTLDLAMPPQRPAKLDRKKVVEVERVRACIPFLPEKHRDVLLLLVGTGWHVEEVRKFAAKGEVMRSVQPGVLAVLVTRQKGGRLTRTGVQLQETLDAAKRIRAAGKIVGNKRLSSAIARACRDAAVRPFHGGVMRHSVATWAYEAGADIDTVSKWLDHRSRKTTEDFYVDSGHAKQGVPVMKML